MSSSRRNFFNVELTLLKTFGISLKTANFINNVYLLFLILVVYSYPIVLSIDLLSYSFDEAVDSWKTMNGYLLGLPLVFGTIVNRAKLKRLLLKLENRIFEEDLLVERWYRWKQIQMTFFFVSVLLTCLTQLIYSIILRYTNEDPKNWRLPFGMISIVNTTYSPGFEIAYVYQFTSIIYFITTCLTSTIIITGLLNFAATQFKIMQLKIKRILTNASENQSKDTIDNSSIQWRFLKTQIEELIRYHEFITEIVQEVSFMYGNMILCNFMGTLCINCVEIYRMSILSLKDSRVVNILAEIITGTFHTMLICKAGQNMTNESEKIAECIYEIDFVGTDLRFQKSIVILLRRAQKPARIKAGGLVNVSTVTSLHVLRLAYSAFTILRNVYNK